MDPPEPVCCAATGKVCHPSRKVAAENLNRVRGNHDRHARDRKERGKLIAYLCKACGSWHTGNQDTGAVRVLRLLRRRPRVVPEIEEEAA